MACPLAALFTKSTKLFKLSSASIWEFFSLKIVIHVFDGYVLVLVNFSSNFTLFIATCVSFVAAYLSFFSGYSLTI